MRGGVPVRMARKAFPVSLQRFPVRHRCWAQCVFRPKQSNRPQIIPCICDALAHPFALQKEEKDRAQKIMDACIKMPDNRVCADCSTLGMPHTHQTSIFLSLQEFFLKTFGSDTVMFKNLVVKIRLRGELFSPRSACLHAIFLLLTHLLMPLAMSSCKSLVCVKNAETCEKLESFRIWNDCDMIWQYLFPQSAPKSSQVSQSCPSAGPRWASMNLGIFVCLNCSGIHRRLGVHISKVKSVTLDGWKIKWAQVSALFSRCTVTSLLCAMPFDLLHIAFPLRFHSSQHHFLHVSARKSKLS